MKTTMKSLVMALLMTTILTLVACSSGDRVFEPVTVGGFTVRVETVTELTSAVVTEQGVVIGDVINGDDVIAVLTDLEIDVPVVINDGILTFVLINGDHYVSVVTINGDGAAVFSDLTFDEAGEFVYEVVLNDEVVETITVIVTESDEYYVLVVDVSVSEFVLTNTLEFDLTKEIQVAFEMAWTDRVALAYADGYEYLTNEDGEYERVAIYVPVVEEEVEALEIVTVANANAGNNTNTNSNNSNNAGGNNRPANNNSNNNTASTASSEWTRLGRLEEGAVCAGTYLRVFVVGRHNYCYAHVNMVLASEESEVRTTSNNDTNNNSVSNEVMTTPEAPVVVERPTHGSFLSQIEAEILVLVNQYRESYDLLPLSTSNEWIAVARSHSRNMAHYDFFSHTCPNGTSPRMRITDAGISAQGWSENISRRNAAATAQTIMDGWMNSPGHRTNILRENSVVIGIGVYQFDGRIFSTQKFGR